MEANSQTIFAEKIFKMNRALLMLMRALGIYAGCAVFFVSPSARALQVSRDSQPASGSWTTSVSKLDTSSFHDGQFTFHALPRTRADIRRSVGRDLITFSARMSGWGSIYLVWGPTAWCAAGQISPTPFARIYSSTTIDGKVEQAKHRGIHLDNARWLRIRMGKNYISFAYGEDDQHWITLRTIKRPHQFSGAPRLAVAGKYYASSEELFASAADEPARRAPVEEVNGQTHGNSTDGKIQDLTIEATPPIQAQLSKDDLKVAVAPPIDPVMSLLAASKNDPTYEEVASYYPPMRYPREVVGVPLHPLDIGVDYLGRLNVNPDKPVAWLELGNPSVPLGEAEKPFDRHLLGGYIPIDILDVTRDNVKYTLTIMGWSDDFDVSKPLYAYLQLHAHSIGGELPSVVSLVSPGNHKKSWQIASKDGTSAQLSIKMQFSDPATALKVSPEEFASRMNAAERLWRDRLSLATRFDLPDQRVMDAYRAWLAYSMLDTDTINHLAEPHDGTGFYETMFGFSVSLYTMMLDEYGLHDYAASILQTQIHFQQPDGLYTAQCGLVDPGAFLVGLARHYRTTGDKQWLKRVMPAMIEQANWIIRERSKSSKSGSTRGLIKYRPYNDYLMPTFNYLGNAMCALGLLDAGEVLAEIGASEGSQFVRSGQRYQQDILASMNASAFISEGQTLLPMEPDTRRLLKLEDYKAGGYYGLTASPLLATGFLTVGDQKTAWIIDALEKRGGLLAGVAEFNGGIDHAYTYGYLLNELALGNVRKTLLGFWSMLAYGMTRTTYSPVEVTMFKTGENELTLPHLYSCTEQLSLLRDMLLREDGNTLQLGEGIPRAWLRSGHHIAVEGAPTKFGTVSYRIEATGDKVDHIRIVPPSRRPPNEIQLHLRAPDGPSIKSIEGGAQMGMTYLGDVITFRDLQKPIEITVYFEKAGT
jgi:hypothetical protein